MTRTIFTPPIALKTPAARRGEEAAESGLPGYEYSAAYAVFAPARTAEAIVKRLTREFVSVLQQPDVRSRFLQNGVEPVGSSPAQLTDKMRYDVDRLGTMIRKLGLGST